MYTKEDCFQDGAERTWYCLTKGNWFKRRKRSWHDALTRTRNTGDRTGVVLFLIKIFCKGYLEEREN